MARVPWLLLLGPSVALILVVISVPWQPAAPREMDQPPRGQSGAKPLYAPLPQMAPSEVELAPFEPGLMSDELWAVTQKWVAREALVLNMDHAKEKLKDFMEHTQAMKFSIPVNRFSGPRIGKGNWTLEAVREFVDVTQDIFECRAGNLGAGVGHLATWKQMYKSQHCAGENQGKYFYIFEDDERLQPHTEMVVARMLGHAARTPESMPDIVQLNVLRPKGEFVMNVPSLSATVPTQVLRVDKDQEAYRWWTTEVEGVEIANVWTSAYLVRCSSVPRLLSEVKQEAKDLDYEHKAFAGDMVLALAYLNPRRNIEAWVLTPMNSATVHIEGQRPGQKKKPSRQGMNGRCRDKSLR